MGCLVLIIAALLVLTGYPGYALLCVLAVCACGVLTDTKNNE